MGGSAQDRDGISNTPSEAEKEKEGMIAESSSGDIMRDREEIAVGQAPVMGELTIPIQDELGLRKLDSRIQEKKKEDVDPFKHLPEHEANILRRQLDIPPVKVTFFTLYR